jgi:hypothetical protein
VFFGYLLFGVGSSFWADWSWRKISVGEVLRRKGKLLVSSVDALNIGLFPLRPTAEYEVRGVKPTGDKGARAVRKGGRSTPLYEMPKDEIPTEKQRRVPSDNWLPSYEKGRPYPSLQGSTQLAGTY